MINLIGDSHVQYLREIIPNSVPIFMGSPTAYNLINKQSEIDSILKGIPLDEPVVMVFGEIDCRVHLIHQSVLQNRSIGEIVKECCDRYLEVIRKIKHDVYVFGMIPSQGDENVLDLNYPRYGTISDRNIVCRMFNDYMRDECKLIDAFRFIRDCSYLDGVHLNRYAIEILVDQCLNKLIISAQVEE